MNNFHRLFSQEGGCSSSRNNLDAEKTTLKSPPMWSSSLVSLRRHCFQKRYLCSWVLFAILPFIILRLMILYTPFQFPASSPISLVSRDLERMPTLSGTPPAQDHVQWGSLVPTDEESWPSSDDWINHGRSPGVEMQKNNGPPYAFERIPQDEELTFKGSRPSPPPATVESFWLPEEKGKEQPTIWVKNEEEKEKTNDLDLMTAEEKESQAKEKEGEDERNTDEQKQDDQKTEGEQKDAEEKTQSKGIGNQPEEKEMEVEKQYKGANLAAENVTIHGNDMEEATSAGECDLFDGNWVHDSEGSLYTNATCTTVEALQNCMKNGKPDTEYLYWKWKPRECDLPRFDANSFLDSFSGKTIGFVGDSLARNQMDSLTCLLSQVEVPTLTYRSADWRTFRWYFKQHRLTVAVVWSPKLLEDDRQAALKFQNDQSTLSLDVLDSTWTSVMDDFDIMVLSTGKWYLGGWMYVREGKVVGCHYCPGLNITMLNLTDTYREAIHLVLDKVAKEFKGIAVMTTFAVSHFEGGTWKEGGQCRREIPLEKPEEGDRIYRFPDMSYEMRDIIVSEFNNIAGNKSKVRKDLHLEILDVTKVMILRADGHPGPYRYPYPYEGKSPDEPVQNDCTHWCLPGPVDTFNQLLVKLMGKYL